MAMMRRALRALEATAPSNTTLGAYNIDPSTVSISGLSAGASFTLQLGIAHSSVFPVGFGVFAGQPYDCARNQSFQLCSNNNHPSLTLPSAHLSSWSGNQIDPIANLASSRVFLWVGEQDRTVGPNVMEQVHTQLSPHVRAANLNYTSLSVAAHTFPTDMERKGDNPCDVSAAPYVSDCGFDGAGEVLKWLYEGDGELKARNNGNLTGALLKFDQEGELVAPGMAVAGYVYVPAKCAGKQACKLHVVMHGCSQSVTDVGMAFVEGAGYNLWADTNNIVVLYPQTMPMNRDYPIFDHEKLSNGPGCWDWLGFYGENCDQKGGVQMAAVVAQVQRLVSGYSKKG